MLLPLQKHRRNQRSVVSNGKPFLHHHLPAFGFQIDCMGMPKCVILMNGKCQKQFHFQIKTFKLNENHLQLTFVIVIFMQLSQLSIVIFREATLRCNVYDEYNKAAIFVQFDIISIRILYGEIVNRTGRFVVNIIAACHFFSCACWFGLCGWGIKE